MVLLGSKAKSMEGANRQISKDVANELGRQGGKRCHDDVGLKRTAAVSRV